MFDDIKKSTYTYAQIYPVNKIAFWAKYLAEHHVPAEDVLEGTGLTVEMLACSATRVSTHQLALTYKNVIQLSSQAGVALIAAQRIQFTDFGMLGYALLSSADVLQALCVMQKYHRLAAPTVSLDINLDNDKPSVTFDDIIKEPSLLRFNIEFQLSVTLSLLKEVKGESVFFDKICLSYPEPKHLQIYQEIFACPVLFNQTSNTIYFDNKWLRQPLLRSNKGTQEKALEVCELMLQDMDSSFTVANDVYIILRDNAGSYPDIESVASRLHISSRTLRRKLEKQGTTYKQLLADVSKELAIQYLRKTSMTIEDIAELLGYSDAANFRGAFKRWTGLTPKAYRAT